MCDRAQIQRFLKDVSVGQIFKPWEITDNLPRLKYELETLAPEVRVLEALHKVAFRRGLGNSLYTPRYRVGAVTSEEVNRYLELKWA